MTMAITTAVSKKAAAIHGVEVMAAEAAEKQIQVAIQSRFGQVTVNLNHAIFFPKGLLGLPEATDFCLTELPDSRLSQFKLLQCLNDYSLSFVVLPLAADNALIEKADMAECMQVTGVPQKEMALLLIVSTQRMPEGLKVHANLRAPIVIDTTERLAIQYVFSNNDYQIKHPLN